MTALPNGENSELVPPFVVQVSGNAQVGKVVNVHTVQGDLYLQLPQREHVIPDQLPHDEAAFTGREAELGRLAALAERAPTVAITAISGIAGVGKSALAVHFAHHVAEDFPDAKLHVDFHGYDPARIVDPAEALASGRSSLWTTSPPANRCGCCCPAVRPA